MMWKNRSKPMAGFRFPIFRLPDWGIVVCAGFVAGTAATLVQVLLWLLFTPDFPGILFRDARLTAALVLGARVLPPPATFGAAIFVVATVIHFALSIAYAAILCPLVARHGNVWAVAAGAVFGVALYVVNLYGFAALFPWFVQARGWIAAVAHVAFGVSAVASCRFLRFRCEGSRAGGH
jgi:hypothetical protein